MVSAFGYWALDIWNSAFGSWVWIYGIRLSVLGFGYMDFGFWFLGFGYTGFGFWLLDVEYIICFSFQIGFSFWFLGIRYTGFDFRFRLLVGFWIYGF
ncbi:unnamed protein product [Rhizophagus irregularis]|nr:unnamed protein product [Rhizophagus irregularis]